MRIQVTNNQKTAHPRIQSIRKLTEYLINTASNLLPNRQWGDISIVLVDNAGMEPFNRKLFEKTGTTDVVSLCYEPVPGENAAWAGDIVVNVELAVEMGRKLVRPGVSWGPERELALYIAHGCDHFMGEDDADEKGRARMRRRELRWVDGAGKEGLLDELLIR
ncbi:MAG: rRNA maturation RNase YbeY [Kiritimatiellia bacterium]|jgi:rRNA maturation RNase YbeY|nr:rRNA maturation RNase YbeY [Kiritimatiellia bacterium]